MTGPDAGIWITDRLAPFGPSVGHAVPDGYPAYAIVPIRPDGDPEADDEGLPTIETSLDVLGPYTGEQRVHCGTWDGWDF